jgi:hypothetical protein
LKIALGNNEFTPNANANDLQLDIGLTACGESRSQPLADRLRPQKAAGFRARGLGSNRKKAQRVAATVAGAAWGFAQMLAYIQRDVDLTCLHRQAGIAWIAEAKSSTHIR